MHYIHGDEKPSLLPFPYLSPSDSVICMSAVAPATVPLLIGQIYSSGSNLLPLLSIKSSDAGQTRCLCQ